MTSLELRPDLSELAALAEGLESFSAAHGVGRDVLSLVHLALEEVVTALSAGVRTETDRRDGHIRIGLQVEGPTLTVRVKTSSDLSAILDLALVSSLMDEVRYEREDGRHVLMIRKALPAEA